MQTEQTQRISISYAWSLGTGTTLDANSNIVLNGSNARTSIDLSGVQQLDIYGFKFICDELDQSEENGVEIRFYTESLSVQDSIEVYLPINDIGEVVQEVKLPIKCAKITLQLYGKWKCNHNNYMYGVSTSVSTATTESVGTVRPLKNSGLVVVEVDNQITGEKAGDLTLNLGDGIQVNKEGQLTTTSELSGSNLQNVKFCSDGMVVNGKYCFQEVPTGLKFLNANRTITIEEVAGSVVDFFNTLGGGSSGI